LGILAALNAREKTGRGQFLDMALLDSQITWLANVGSSYLNAKAVPQRWGNAHPSIVPYEVFRGGDGRCFVVGVGTEALWKKFLRRLEMESDVGQDERFRTNALRTKNRAELIPLLQKAFDSQPASAWLERLTAALIPAAPINTVEEAVSDTQMLARNMIVELKHPALGKALGIGNPIKFSETPVNYRFPPPLLGEHTTEVLCGLGYSDEEVRTMSGSAAS
jgi:crotonobetainyl-CoA:carnitine CoA-transferase CaiB-like acyl-CoA transferase